MYFYCHLGLHDAWIGLRQGTKKLFGLWFPPYHPSLFSIVIGGSPKRWVFHGQLRMWDEPGAPKVRVLPTRAGLFVADKVIPRSMGKCGTPLASSSRHG